jgi:hypothetical protein
MGRAAVVLGAAVVPACLRNNDDLHVYPFGLTYEPSPRGLQHRGGGFVQNVQGLRCDQNISTVRSSGGHDNGIRCCSK